ncbi:amino acid ABC transporter permease [Lacrimispora sp.]|uniref:amino acid ABC transporter permease n=1 Tax=Lacrimispora sp. TaxID=2719234 RepID=UPI0028AF7178|nr:amino acid ABC transporter permease [Lacrimispora sp.]
MGKLFAWDRFYENIPKILPYLSVTFSIVVYATVFGVLLGMVIVLVQIKKIPGLSQLVKVYVSFMRGTPMLVQLMLVYYGIPALLDPILGTRINREWGAVNFAYVTFILNQGAFLSAIFYSAITSIPYGQTEAGLSAGLTEFQTFYRIVLPQMVKTALPPFGSDLVGLFQNSSLVFLIGVTDIMGRAKTIGTATKHVLEAYVFVVIIYIVISLSVRLLFFRLNNKMKYGKEEIG